MKIKLLLLFPSMAALAVKAQLPVIESVLTPMESQKAMVMQRVGITDITVTYGRPAVKARKLWGALVPYNEGKPYPWRAGANENTVISFSTDVEIEGKELKAGIYGVHMIPAEKAWTVIFSSNSNSWGSFSYRPTEDAIRVEITPIPVQEKREFLAYEFADLTDSSATMKLVWENLSVPVKLHTDTRKNVVNKIDAEGRSSKGFAWEYWYSAASYLYFNNYRLDRALAYVSRAANADNNFSVLKLKSDILRKTNNVISADSVLTAALRTASFNEMTKSGIITFFANDYPRAKLLFETAYARFDHSFTVLYYLGKINAALGNKESAIKFYNEAQPFAINAQQKQSLDAAIKNM
ncbi:MAG: hypothetical protein JWN76_1663 [Chitinophagaceae bacterium]|nr:hypothetical protein [Chitinophagaceae bacterium]